MFNWFKKSGRTASTARALKALEAAEAADQNALHKGAAAAVAEAERLAPHDFPHNDRLGLLLFRYDFQHDAQARLTQALDAYESATRHGHGNGHEHEAAPGKTQKTSLPPDALAALAALADKKADVPLAERAQLAFAHCHPHEAGEEASQETIDHKPNSADQVDRLPAPYIRWRSLSDSRYVIRGNHRRTARLTGGLMATYGFFQDARMPCDELSLHREDSPVDRVLGYTGPNQVIINSIACADTHAGLLSALVALESRFGDRLINRPSRILETSRARIANHISTLDGLDTAPLLSFDHADRLFEALDKHQLSLPLILRRRDTHTGKSVEKIETKQELERYFAHFGRAAPYYATEFRDIRTGSDFYHKYRVFFIDGLFYPVARVANDQWQIHSGDRYRVMVGTPDLIALEKDYLNNPKNHLGSKAYHGLCALSETLKLDFFGVDFALQADGSAFVFEANAAMRHNFDHVESFPHTEAPLATVSHAFRTMIASRMPTALANR